MNFTHSLKYKNWFLSTWYEHLYTLHLSILLPMQDCRSCLIHILTLPAYYHLHPPLLTIPILLKLTNCVSSLFSCFFGYLFACINLVYRYDFDIQYFITRNIYTVIILLFVFLDTEMGIHSFIFTPWIHPEWDYSPLECSMFTHSHTPGRNLA